MNLQEALEALNKYQPAILIMGVKNPEDGNFGLQSTLVTDKKSYLEAMKQYVSARVFLLKEGVTEEINKKYKQ